VSRGGILLGAVTLVVVATVVVALVLIGAPGEARQVQLDARRVEDLRALAGAVRVEARIRRRLPASLAEIHPQIRGEERADPVTHAPYAYAALPDGRFVLGARFDRVRTSRELEAFENAWAHGAGEWRFWFPADELTDLPDSGAAAR